MTTAVAKTEQPRRPAWAKELDDREYMFVSEYIVDMNATRAALEVFPTENRASAATMGCRLKNRPDVREAIDKALRDPLPALKLSLTERLAAIALANPADYMQWDTTDIESLVNGKVTRVPRLTLTPSNMLDARQMAAIKGVKHRVNQHGETVELQFHDAIEAIEKLTDIMGLNRRHSEGGVGAVTFIIEFPDGTTASMFAQASSNGISAEDRRRAIEANAEPVDDEPPGGGKRRNNGHATNGFIIEEP